MSSKIYISYDPVSQFVIKNLPEYCHGIGPVPVYHESAVHRHEYTHANKARCIHGHKNSKISLVNNTLPDIFEHVGARVGKLRGT